VIGIGDLNAVGVGLVGFGDCGMLDVAESAFDMNRHCSTPAASTVAVAPPEDSYVEVGDGGPVQHGRCHLSSMP
jgi:hypothetical protein